VSPYCHYSLRSAFSHSLIFREIRSLYAEGRFQLSQIAVLYRMRSIARDLVASMNKYALPPTPS
jgi:superfamily I DNA/RNA helicase